MRNSAVSFYGFWGKPYWIIVAGARLCVQAFDVSVPEWANNREKLARIADEFDVPEFQPKESTDATDADGDDREAVIEKLCPLRVHVETNSI